MVSSEVTVTFGGGTPPVTIHLDSVQPMTSAEARAWLDHEFREMECEPPVRPTGKMLAVDKVAIVAEAAGVARFADNAWAREFARAAVAMLNKPVVRVDVATMTVSF